MKRMALQNKNMIFISRNPGPRHSGTSLYPGWARAQTEQPAWVKISADPDSCAADRASRRCSAESCCYNNDTTTTTNNNNTNSNSDDNDDNNDNDDKDDDDDDVNIYVLYGAICMLIIHSAFIVYYSTV